MKRQFVMLAIVTLLVSHVAIQNASAADSLIEYEKLLVPFSFTYIPGAYGSIWTMSFTVTNPLDVGVLAYPNFGPPSGSHPGLEPPCCVPAPLIPRTTYRPVILGDLKGRGVFFFVDKRYVDQIQMTLRLQDISREAETWGTVIPVVRSREFVDRAVSLNDIPVNSRFRVTIRVYSFDGTLPATVAVTAYGTIAEETNPADVLLESRTFALSYDPSLFPDGVSYSPGFLQIPSLASLASFAGYSRARIDIKPTSPDTRIWAFASVTNNETQHVTVIVPSTQ